MLKNLRILNILNIDTTDLQVYELFNLECMIVLHVIELLHIALERKINNRSSIAFGTGIQILKYFS